MPIEIKASSNSLFSNTTQTFSFSDQVVSHVVGVSFFGFDFDSSQQVQKIALRVTSNQVGEKVYAHANTVMDGDDHSITSSCFIHLSCVAVTGGTDTNIALASASAIAGGGQSQPLSIPFPPRNETAFLSGFSTSIGEGSGTRASISRFGASVGAVTDGNTASITGRANLYSNGQGGSRSPTVDGGLVCTDGQEMGWVVKESGHYQNSHSLDVVMPQPVSAVVAMLQSFELKMDSSQDSEIQSISVGGQHYDLQNDNKTVNFDSGIRTLASGGGHAEDYSSSYASMVLFGLPLGS